MQGLGVKLTMGTYSHVLPTMQNRAAEVMDRILGHKTAEAANG